MSRRTAFSAQTLAVLAALAAQPSDWRHGYDLAGETGLKSGTLYPILVRLADREIVQASWEAVRAEAELVPAGWRRVGWLAGGLRLAAKEAEIMRKVVYWLGVAMVAAAAAWAVWLSWHTSPAADALTVTDRVRVLAGVAALAVMPWVGRPWPSTSSIIRTITPA
jgi:PadR family transcriptional regulator PadR